ncbi:single hybrid motif-containing protein [Obba rivulosa]|uniref:Single hybrid motif-containing protein n=1 Tax=Obba rivulosa TaxID=1052685 RepID=A0A8E2DI95_9APHY|nr:single hybrid motif-containing protein [Obba rivulosa]
MLALRQVSRTAARSVSSRRWIQASATCRAITNLEMPAMSPTMTEGGIAHWKKKEGEAFSAGDVLLEIETDKATIDVEAQDDGVLGKILAQDGTKGIPVGKIIAILAEEGDDISNLQPPAEKEKPSAPKQEASTSAPPPPAPVSNKQESVPSAPRAAEPVQHARPLFPSVLRLLEEHGIADAGKIKGTGVRGMLTKGDVLAFLGKASSPTGTYKEPPNELPETQQKAAKQEAQQPLDGAAIRRLIVGSMLDASVKARAAAAPPAPADFDSIIADYLPPSKEAPATPPVPPPTKSTSGPEYLDGLL